MPRDGGLSRRDRRPHLTEIERSSPSRPGAVGLGARMSTHLALVAGGWLAWSVAWIFYGLPRLTRADRHAGEITCQTDQGSA